MFPSGFEATIASKSWRLRAEPALKGELAAGPAGGRSGGVLLWQQLCLLARVQSPTLYFVR